ncbi:Retrovirus-related Pol polyprotein from transposon RE1 [Vitis vinifera]|uniref:Retrovirus-related Pol polyprotein from transposon RE1 n=1 Tax=Vitis vinifera TaxID=29760 RepID=A0A438EN35_VITVI|nr:Retrovirus-related Pol polyprotein from transposon RE1 [Vitis vinifera]
MVVMSFLSSLPSEFETAKSQILSGFDIGSLQEVFSRVLRTENVPSLSWPYQEELQEITESESNKSNCQCATSDTGTSSDSSDKIITMTVEEFAKYSQYQEALKASTPVSALTESSKTCLVSFSNKWIIDLGVTNHMTDLMTKRKFAKPPIVQVYSQCPVTTDTCPAPAPLSSDPSSDLNLPISLRKGNDDANLPIPLLTLCLMITCHLPREIRALEDNHTWKLVDLPQGNKVVGCKWVFAVKVNPDGSMVRLKVRLVARGYAQTYEVDYSDTFSPIAKLTSVRLFISIAASQQWMIHQLDFKNVFLHDDLEKEVYIEQPPGFVAQREYGKVCCLEKALYGLKQSPRAWFGKFSKEIQAFDMNKSKKDHSIFYKKSVDGIILLVVHICAYSKALGSFRVDFVLSEEDSWSSHTIQ